VRLRGLAALLGVLLLAGCGGGSGPLDEAALQRQAETLQSTAGEGALMAAVLQDDGLTAPYQRVHADELAALARTQAATLRERGGTAGTRADVARLAQAADQAAQELDALAAASPDDAARLRAQLAGAAATAAELADA
jgi:hypothetical protein